MVVFDRPVEETSAETVANYSLASGGIVDEVVRLDAPDDNRVVLRVRNQLTDGDPEAVTVHGIKSLEDGTPMPEPQTFGFANGVLELPVVDAPDPSWFIEGCNDRSRFSGDGEPGGRVSYTGTVTGKFGAFYTLQGDGNTRAGLWVNAGDLILVIGHAYTIAGALEEVVGQTQA
jgi:hypothetical protein